MFQRQFLSVVPAKEVVCVQEDQVTEDRPPPETSRGHNRLEVFGILSFVLIGVEVYRGMIDFGDLWLVPILAVLAYLAADFLSGFVHFLADNFGSVDPLAPGSAGS
jgi:hypothetical protein